MKRLILLITFVVYALTAFSQDTIKHQKFLGVEIDGTYQSFISKMRSKGFCVKSNESAIITLLNGTFTGRHVNLIVPNEKQLSRIIVKFDDRDNWYDLLNTYKYYCDQYAEKYGNPTSINEEYKGLFDGQNYIMMRKLNEGCITYNRVYSTDLGWIMVSIQGMNDFMKSKGCVFIMYSDKFNYQKQQQSYSDDL